MSDKPVSDKPVSDKPVSDKPVSDKPVSDEPVSDKPVSDEPVSDEPVSDKPVSDKPVSDKPVSDKSDVTVVCLFPLHSGLLQVVCFSASGSIGYDSSWSVHGAGVWCPLCNTNGVSGANY